MKPITPWHFSLLTAFGLVAFFLGPPLIQQCGHGPEVVSSRGGGTASYGENADADADGRRLITLSISMVNLVAELNLTATARDYRMRLTGCDSGYELDPMPLNATSFDVYEGDENCRVELVELLEEGEALLLSEDFTDFAPGDEALFVGASDSDLLVRMTVMDQLSSPVSATDVVRYGYRESNGGEEAEVDSDSLKTLSTLTVEGMRAPPYRMTAVQMDKAKKGKVPLTFYMGCSAITMPGGALFCDGQEFAALTYAFVEAPADPVDLAWLEALFTGGSQPAAADSVVTAEGFQLGLTMTLKEVRERKTWLLIFRNEGGSYSWYTLKVKKKGVSS